MSCDDKLMGVMKVVLHLMKSGDLGLWLSPRVMRKLKAFAARDQGEGGQEFGEVNDTVFLSWLLEGGSMEPKVHWEVESLPNNGGIYRILLEGGDDGKGVHRNQS